MDGRYLLPALREIEGTRIVSPWYYGIAKRVLSHLLFLFAELKVSGDLHLATDMKGVVIATNHIHRVDMLCLISLLPIPVVLVMAEDVYPGHPWLSALIRFAASRMGCITIRRDGRSNRQALLKMQTVLRSGGAILIAPEGNKSRDGTLMAAHDGAAYLALTTGAQLWPITTWGYTSGERGIVASRRLQINVNVGSPFSLEGLGENARENRRLGTELLMASLASLLPEEYRGAFHPSRPNHESIRV